MTLTWTDVGELLARGAAAEFEADLVVRPRATAAPPVMSWVMDDPRANVHAVPGRSRITRAGGSRVRLDHPDGRSTLFNEGTVWQVAPGEAATRFRVMSLTSSGWARHLIDQPDNAEEALGYGFPCEPLRESTHQGRPVTVMAGDPGDGGGALEFSLDAHTGVLLRVAATDGSWEARLEKIEFKKVDASTFRWTGPADPPQPIRPSAEWIPAPSTRHIAPGEDPETPPENPRRRLLRTRLDELVIADGQLSPPRVGETIDVHLTFFEDPPPPGATSTVFRAIAEPIGNSTPGEDHLGRLRWPTILRGDGWTARWSAPRPSVGNVVVNGNLAIVHDAAAANWFTPTRAAVTRIRVNRLTSPLQPEPDSDEIPGNAWSDEASCPTFFAPHLDHHAAGVNGPAIAVALDLDLDSAETPRDRNDFEPGGLSALDDEIWAGDHHRPILQRRRGDDPGRHEEHLLPLPVSVHSQGVTPLVGTDGFWIEHEQELWSVDTARGEPVQIRHLDEVAWGSAVTLGPHLVTSGRHLRRFDTTQEVDPIELPPAMDTAGVLARVDEGLLVIGREPPRIGEDDDLGVAISRRHEPQRFRLAVYHHSQQWAIGASFGLPGPATAIGQGSTGVWVLCSDLLLRFDESLRRTTVHRLPYSPIAAGPTASGLWLTLDSQRIALGLRDPDASDPWGLRPSLREIGPRGECRHGLVVRLDCDLRLEATVLTERPRPSVAVTSDDTVWFSGRSLRGICADGRLIDG